MTEITSLLRTRPMLTTRQWILIAAGILVLAGAVGALKYLMGPGDEPPIRVKNGSMLIELEAGNKWEDNGGDGWSPSNGYTSGLFYVRITSDNPDDDCAPVEIADGKKISIDYSDKTAATFEHHRKFLILSKPRTKVKPKGMFTDPPLPPSLLVHGDPSDAFHISGIAVSGGGRSVKCTFNSDSQLSEIVICPTPNLACAKTP